MKGIIEGLQAVVANSTTCLPGSKAFRSQMWFRTGVH